MSKLITRFATLIAVLVAGPALAAPDNCSAGSHERSAFLFQAIVDELDRGRGAANHPDWMRNYLGDPDYSGTWVASYCAENPQAKLATAIQLVR
jgi:hypothetical protein